MEYKIYHYDGTEIRLSGMFATFNVFACNLTFLCTKVAFPSWELYPYGYGNKYTLLTEVCN